MVTEHERAAMLRTAQEQAQAIGRMGGEIRELRREVTALEWECAKLRYYAEALERRTTTEEHAAAVAEAQAAVALHGPLE